MTNISRVENYIFHLCSIMLGIGFGIFVPLMISNAIKLASTDMPTEQQVAREFLPLFVASMLAAVCLGFVLQIYKKIPMTAMFFVGFNMAFVGWLYMGTQSPDRGNSTMYELLMIVHFVLAGILFLLTLASKVKIVTGKARPGLVTDRKD